MSQRCKYGTDKVKKAGFTKSPSGFKSRIWKITAFSQRSPQLKWPSKTRAQLMEEMSVRDDHSAQFWTECKCVSGIIHFGFGKGVPKIN